MGFHRRIHKLISIFVLLSFLLNPLQPIVNAGQSSTAAQGQNTVALEKEPSPPAPPQPCDGGSCTDTTQGDFEAGTGENLDTTSQPDAVGLALRPLPVANADSDQTVNEGPTIILDGSASQSPSGDLLSYSWKQTTGPAGILQPPTSVQTTFLPPDITTDTNFSFTLTVNDGSLQSWTDSVVITVLADNDAPLADAREDQTAHEGTLVRLDGSGSSDINGDNLTFAWSQTSGTTATLSNLNAREPTFTVPDVSRDEALVFQLIVNDGELDSHPDTMQVFVTADNEPPVADAGSDQTVDNGSLVNLDASGSSDPNGDQLSYRWTQTAGYLVTIMGADTSNPIFVAPYPPTDETLNFQVRVSDGEFSATDSVQVIVRAQPRRGYDFDWTVVGEGEEIWSDYLWEIRWFGCDVGHDNVGTLYPSGHPICGTSNCPGGPEWPYCWGPAYRQPEFSEPNAINWTIDPVGSISLGFTQDHQVYALTYFYVESDTSFDSACYGGYRWLDGESSDLTLSLTPGWHSLEITSYHQHEGSSFSCSADFAAKVRLMSSNPNDTQTTRMAAGGGTDTVTLADGDKDLGSFDATPLAEKGGLFLGPITYTVNSNNPDVNIYFSDTLQGTTNNANAHVIVSYRGELPQPTISDFNPKQGTVGSEVTIQGANFDADNLTSNKVFFNNILAAVLSATETNLTARVPEEATSGPITVSTPNGTVTSSQDFTVTGQDQVSPQASRLSTAASVVTSLQADPLSGAASTGIPIAVPPGRQGIEPALALTYNSAGGASWVGVGWDLHHSFIERSTRLGKPDYDDSTDTFIVNVPGAKLNLDNVELLRTRGNEFRAKNEASFARFVFDGTSWQVWAKDGTQYLFGSDSHDRMTNTEGIYRWYLNRVVDTNGNYMALSYRRDQGQLYLWRIEYTGNQNTGASPKNRVEFTLEPRANAVSNYVSGAQVIMAKRLAAIEITTGGALVRRYDFGYTYSASSGRSLLSSVTEYGSDGVTALPVVRLRYQQSALAGWNQASGWTVPLEAAFTTGDNDDRDNGVRLVDLNGDALVDLVQAAGTDMARHRSWLNTGSGWRATSDWVVPQAMGFTNDDDEDNGVRLADVDGDGLIDLVRGYGSEQAVHLNTGTGWTPSGWSLPAGAAFLTDGGEDNAMRLADVNGDGLADLVQSYDTDPARHRVWLNTGSGWSLSTWTVPTEAGFVKDDGQSNGVQLADVNGDGLDDLLQSYGNSPGQHRVWLNNNAGWAAATAVVPLGTEFTEGFDDRIDNGVRLADVNGDGRVDFIQADGGVSGQQRVWLNNGLAWDNPTYNVPPEAAFTEPSNGHADNGVRLADVDGDGLIDLIQSDGGDAAQHQVWLNSGEAPDLLVEVGNGIGGNTSVTYQPSTAFDNTGGDGHPDLPFVLQTAVSVTTYDGMGNSYTVTTIYAGGFFDAVERDFRGFAYARVTDPDDNYSESWFHQDDVYKGMLDKTEARDAGGALLRQTTNTWGVSQPYPGASFVFLQQMDTVLHDGGGSYTTRVGYQYDGYGNLIAEVNVGDVSISGDEVYAYTEYATNLDTWVLGSPSHTTIKDAGGTTYAETWFDYDGLANGQVGGGNLTRQRSWLDTGEDPEVSFSYDAYGNLVSATDALGHTTTTTYESNYHTFPTTVTNPLGHSASSVHDPKTGQVLQATDANGNTIYYEYDIFGVLLKTIQPGDSAGYPSLSYSYSLTTLPIKTTVAARERSNSSDGCDACNGCGWDFYCVPGDNATHIYWATRWAEYLYDKQYTAGKETEPFKYKPCELLPRVQASVFVLRIMHGIDYTPPPAEGIFADMPDTGYWGTKWAEQAYRWGLLPDCGVEGGKPKFCPNDQVNRAWGAYMVVQAKDLSVSKTVPQPTLDSPADGSTPAGSQPTLTWDVIAGATWYHVQVADTGNLGGTAMEENEWVQTTDACSGGQCSWQVDDALANGSYDWRVRGRDAQAHLSPWSAVWDFIISVT